MADPVRVLVRAAVLGFHPRDVAEVDRDDKHVAAAIAGKHLIVLDDDQVTDAGGGPDEVDPFAAISEALATVLGSEGTAAELVAAIASDDVVASLDLLRRAGVTFTDDQVANVTELVAADDLDTARSIIINEVAAQVGLTPDDEPEA